MNCTVRNWTAPKNSDKEIMQREMMTRILISSAYIPSFNMK